MAVFVTSGPRVCGFKRLSQDAGQKVQSEISPAHEFDSAAWPAQQFPGEQGQIDPTPTPTLALGLNDERVGMKGGKQVNGALVFEFLRIAAILVP